MLEERRRLAREIHDTLLQGVVGIAVQLRALLAAAERRDNDTTEQLRSVIALAEQTVHEARHAVWNLRSPQHTRYELSRHLELIATERAGANTEVRVSVIGTPREIGSSQRTAAIRIVQEAVTNAVRHGGAKRIDLRIDYGTHRCRLTITDDGVGFVADHRIAGPEEGWGMRGMYERARRLGGSLSVRSAPGAGTSVLVVLPYRRSRASNGVDSLVLSRRGE